MKLDTSIAAVVTDGASGLGEGIARALAAKGVKVTIFDMNVTAGSAIAAAIGGLFCKVDVTSDAEVEAGFAKARAAHGRERVFVNCAGIATGAKTVARKKDTGEITLFDEPIRQRLGQRGDGELLFLPEDRADQAPSPSDTRRRGPTCSITSRGSTTRPQTLDDRLYQPR